MTEKAKIGALGEDLACRYLVGRGFTVVDRNYRKPWGEIDIVARSRETLHFIEVKSVTRESFDQISHENSGYRPEDNVHSWKLKRLSRTIQTYLAEKGSEVGDWQFDVMTVYLVPAKKQTKIEFLQNVVL